VNTNISNNEILRQHVEYSDVQVKLCILHSCYHVSLEISF